jgi:hypothetical protein
MMTFLNNLSTAINGIKIISTPEIKFLEYYELITPFHINFVQQMIVLTNDMCKTLLCHIVQ